MNKTGTNAGRFHPFPAIYAVNKSLSRPISGHTPRKLPRKRAISRIIAYARFSRAQLLYYIHFVKSRENSRFLPLKLHQFGEKIQEVLCAVCPGSPLGQTGSLVQREPFSQPQQPPPQPPQELSCPLFQMAGQRVIFFDPLLFHVHNAVFPGTCEAGTAFAAQAFCPSGKTLAQAEFTSAEHHKIMGPHGIPLARVSAAAAAPAATARAPLPLFQMAG